MATITLARPERKNPLTFDSYAELRDTFRALVHAPAVKAVVLTGAGGNFCSGGDVHDIIGPLTRMNVDGLLNFTRMTGDLVRAMRACPQPIIAAVDGTCAGAGAILAMVSDIRIATPNAKTSFLFVRVGLAGCDMGACAILPRLIGHGRASELLFTGRAMTAEEGERWGFYNRIVAADGLPGEAMRAARELADGPTFAHAMTKADAESRMVDEHRRCARGGSSRRRRFACRRRISAALIAPLLKRRSRNSRAIEGNVAKPPPREVESQRGRAESFASPPNCCKFRPPRKGKCILPHDSLTCRRRISIASFSTGCRRRSCCRNSVSTGRSFAIPNASTLAPN